MTIFRHIIQINDNNIPIFPTAFEIKEAKMKNKFQTVNKIVEISKK